MKKCENCDREYDDKRFVKCPNCRPENVPAAKAKASNGCGTIFALIGVLLVCGIAWTACSSGGGGNASQDDPALAAKVEAALESEGGAAAVYDVSAESDGGVYVTLTVRAEDLGGEVYARDAANAVAAIVFAKVPEVTSVGVFDADNSIIGSYKR